MGFSIVICGAGLGGLAAAISLKKKGNNVVVLEAAPQLDEVGAGIQIPPNSSRLLKEWGVYDEVRKMRSASSEHQFQTVCNGRHHRTNSASPKHDEPVWNTVRKKNPPGVLLRVMIVLTCGKLLAHSPCRLPQVSAHACYESWRRDQAQ